jgi:hypothetical protein
MLVALYVDDLMIAASKRSMLKKFQADISNRFDMKDLGPLTCPLQLLLNSFLLSFPEITSGATS